MGTGSVVVAEDVAGGGVVGEGGLGEGVVCLELSVGQDFYVFGWTAGIGMELPVVFEAGLSVGVVEQYVVHHLQLLTQVGVRSHHSRPVLA